MADFIKISGNDFLKERLKRILRTLPENWKTILFEKHPEYNNYKGVTLIANIIYFRSSDATLTQILEDIANEYQEELKKGNLK